jgi:hypothetical protein
MSEEEPQIIIDEGWKAQVQREKEVSLETVAEAPEAVDSPDASGDEQPEGALDMEQASFAALVGSLATQIMFALGLVADPNSGQVMVNLDAARYTLDILTVLEEKTKGNLSDEELEMLTQTSSELEQAFAVRLQQFQEQAMQQAGVDPGNLQGE